MSDFSKELVELVWGRPASGAMTESLFRRWTQGFLFSESESTALEQLEGGPCAVIAPVQAFLLKNVLFNYEGSNWREISEEEQKAVLCHTLCEILERASLNKSGSYCLATWSKGKTSEENSEIGDTPPESSRPTEDQQPSALPAEELRFERFHTFIQKRTLNTTGELKEAVLALYDMWRNTYGVLLFLYSVILTKGIENIKNEIEDTLEPLIDPVYGHGSQSLINLLVTGHAVSNVWDGDRECSGMKLHGIHEQASVGFLTLMESLRYCKVGAFLKSPQFPIWILGSETHLSVFFAKEMALVAPESPSEQARRVFQTFDPEGSRPHGSLPSLSSRPVCGNVPRSVERICVLAVLVQNSPIFGSFLKDPHETKAHLLPVCFSSSADNGFIPDTLLEDVMKALDLVTEPEYVNLMKTKLDPEGLGIVLLGPFLLEFFPDQDSGIPDSFPVYHCNGLKQSNHNEKVMYVEGTALILGFEDPMVRTDDTPIKRCLQTKWPYIELLWTTDRSPSLN
ncbi:protein FAM188A-like [Scleropages formosus]|uniref:Ubiquitin carboxyl-terminal hydrolase MINDY n=1 Tax=Scleropages formosus TaxID=113540 RepID=A0A0N8JWW3_SCLFO|nr:protein FAM188A-like [Scleropages formosus]